MTAPLRLAVFGLGRWGGHLVRNFLALPGVEVVAVVDSQAEVLARLQDQLELPESVQGLTDWQAAMELPGLEAVAIATPAATHYSLIKAALERSLHVLTEKPMTLSVKEGQELYALAAQHQRQLLVDHTYLFHPVVRAAKQVFLENRLGNLRYGYAARTNLGPVRSDVDALWDLAIHDIAMLNFWLAETPAQAAAWGSAWLQPQAQPLFSTGLVDVGWVRLVYPSQFEATLHVSWLNADKQRRLGVVGERGTLVFDELAQNSLTLYQGALQSETAPFSPTAITPMPLLVEGGEPLAQVCRHFLACIQGQQESEVSAGVTATSLVQILTALTQSLQNGGTLVSL
ncbi:MAG: Gfo/Idh/MocA family oxidoreductase [Cyanobacteria bacterium Co-bin13]|nr:Gfo/Idh/MocA family oxidoreductase [Cyanobacteria bacterium Co-bin13]